MADRKLKDLHDDPANPRKIADDFLARLGRSMQEFGDLSGLIFNRSTGQLVGGHQRKKKLPPDANVVIVERFKKPTEHGTVAIGYVEAGEERWSYREVEWDEDRQRLANIAANNSNLQGEYEFSALADLLADFEGRGIDASLAGYDQAELERLLTWTPGGGVDQAEHWTGMPEYQHDNLSSKRRIIVHFRSNKDVEEFGRIIGQAITDQTRALWFPVVEIDIVADKYYGDETEEK